MIKVSFGAVPEWATHIGIVDPDGLKIRVYLRKCSGGHFHDNAPEKSAGWWPIPEYGGRSRREGAFYPSLDSIVEVTPWTVRVGLEQEITMCRDEAATTATKAKAAKVKLDSVLRALDTHKSEHGTTLIAGVKSEASR